MRQIAASPLNLRSGFKRNKENTWVIVILFVGSGIPHIAPLVFVDCVQVLALTKSQPGRLCHILQSTYLHYSPETSPISRFVVSSITRSTSSEKKPAWVLRSLPQR